MGDSLGIQCKMPWFKACYKCRKIHSGKLMMYLLYICAVEMPWDDRKINAISGSILWCSLDLELITWVCDCIIWWLHLDDLTPWQQLACTKRHIWIGSWWRRGLTCLFSSQVPLQQRQGSLSTWHIFEMKFWNDDSPPHSSLFSLWLCFSSPLFLDLEW